MYTTALVAAAVPPTTHPRLETSLFAMKQPSSQPAPSRLPSLAPTPTATEIVRRPEPGLARGKWEAPAWVFWAILALVLVSTTSYVLRRLGLLKLRKGSSAPGEPPSTKMRRP